MEIKHYFATRLKALREEKKLNQGQLANAIGISRGSISFYENGDRTPDIEILCKIANYFDVDCDYLLGISNLKKSKNKNIDAISAMGLNDNVIKKIVENNKKYSNLVFPANPINVLCDDDGYLPHNDKFFEAIIKFIEFRISATINLSTNYQQEKELVLPFADAKQPLEKEYCVLLTGYDAADYYLSQAQKYLEKILLTYSSDYITAFIHQLKLNYGKNNPVEITSDFFEQIKMRNEAASDGNSTEKK